MRFLPNIVALTGFARADSRSSLVSSMWGVADHLAPVVTKYADPARSALYGKAAVGLTAAAADLCLRCSRLTG